MIKLNQWIETTSQVNDGRTTFIGQLHLRTEVTVDSFLLETTDYNPKRLEEKAKAMIWEQLYGDLIPDLDAIFELVLSRPITTAKAYEAVRSEFAKIRQKLEYKQNEENPITNHPDTGDIRQGTA